MKDTEKRVSISGVIVEVKKYYQGIMLVTGKGRKIHIKNDLLKKILNHNIEETSDFEKTLSLIGTKVKAIGQTRKWYGGKYKCYVEAENIELQGSVKLEGIENLPDKEKKERIKNLLKEVLRISDKDRTVEKIIKTALISPELILTKRFKEKKKKKQKNIPTINRFPVLFTIYRMLTGRKLLPSKALANCLEWVLNELYREERKISVRYLDAVNFVEDYFFKIPERPDEALREVGGKLSVVKIEKDERGQVKDFIFTTWEVRSSIAKILEWIFTKTGDTKEVAEVKANNIAKKILIEGRYIPEQEKEIQVKVFPATLGKVLLREKNVIAVTGSGGAGKTTFLKELKRVLEEEGEKVYIFALTRNVAQITKGETLKQLCDHGIPDISRNVFFDESFTIDLKHLKNIIEATEDARVIFAGDPEQNPPPEGYEAFAKILYPILQEKGLVLRGIGVHRFKGGRIRVVFFPAKITENVIEAYLRTVIPVFEKKRKEWFVVSFFHWNKMGTIELNKMIRNILKKPEELSPEEKVIITQPAEVKLNGCGLTRRIGKSRCILKAIEDDKAIVYLSEEEIEVEVDKRLIAPGYALEVYHSQGLEADCVIFFATQLRNGNPEEFRKKLKVGLTRARDMTFVLVPYHIKDDMKNLITDILGNQVELTEVSSFRELVKIANGI